MPESDCVATTTIAVHRDAWDTLCPNLPADVAAMVAPPVTVSTFPVVEVPRGEARRRAKPARLRATMPAAPPYGRRVSTQ
jgi:hypothetical protein